MLSVPAHALPVCFSYPFLASLLAFNFAFSISKLSLRFIFVASGVLGFCLNSAAFDVGDGEDVDIWTLRDFSVWVGVGGGDLITSRNVRLKGLWVDWEEAEFVGCSLEGGRERGEGGDTSQSPALLLPSSSIRSGLLTTKTGDAMCGCWCGSWEGEGYNDAPSASGGFLPPM